MGGALTTLTLLVHVAKFGVFGQQFKSVPTTVKTYENETVLLPCYHNGKLYLFQLIAPSNMTLLPAVTFDSTWAESLFIIYLNNSVLTTTFHLWSWSTRHSNSQFMLAFSSRCFLWHWSDAPKNLSPKAELAPRARKWKGTFLLTQLWAPQAQILVRAEVTVSVQNLRKQFCWMGQQLNATQYKQSS